jgi:hypothetical protein
MTTITLEGKEYQFDIEQAKKLNLLKEKDNRVRSWKEFVNKHIKSNSFYCSEGIVSQTISPYGLPEQLTSHEAKALAAFSKLLKLRRDWIGEWEPDWEESNRKFILYRSENEVRTCSTSTSAGVLSFPTQQMAQEFLKTFHDLIEEAKILI